MASSRARTSDELDRRSHTVRTYTHCAINEPSRAVQVLPG
jgi:hypothetical protein